MPKAATAAAKRSYVLASVNLVPTSTNGRSTNVLRPPSGGW